MASTIVNQWWNENVIMQIMDTPLPAQIRPIQQEAGQAAEADVMELVEMILGASWQRCPGAGQQHCPPP